MKRKKSGQPSCSLPTQNLPIKMKEKKSGQPNFSIVVENLKPPTKNLLRETGALAKVAERKLNLSDMIELDGRSVPYP